MEKDRVQSRRGGVCIYDTRCVKTGVHVKKYDLSRFYLKTIVGPFLEKFTGSLVLSIAHS